MNKQRELQELYENQSKHSNYQILPTSIKEVLKADSISTNSRFEKERLSYFSSKVNFSDKKILDIGGNTGYFSFETVDLGAKEVHHYEGDSSHSNFVKKAAEVLELESKVRVTNKYFLFDNTANEKYDICLLLNVLHHLGDDYGDDKLNLKKTKETIIEQLNMMSNYADTVIFQMGFCWQGDRNKLLFENGTKSEMIDYISSGIIENWDIEEIGIAERSNGSINYMKLSDKNIGRDDTLGEFLNRPVFILKSKTFQK